MSRILSINLLKIVSGVDKPDTGHTVILQNLDGTTFAAAPETSVGVSGVYQTAAFTEVSKYCWWNVDGTNQTANGPVWVGKYDVVSGSICTYTTHNGNRAIITTGSFNVINISGGTSKANLTATGPLQTTYVNKNTPSVAGALSTGDRIVLYDDGTAKGAMGVETGYVYIQSPSSGIKFYNGTTKLGTIESDGSTVFNSSTVSGSLSVTQSVTVGGTLSYTTQNVNGAYSYRTSASAAPVCQEYTYYGRKSVTGGTGNNTLIEIPVSAGIYAVEATLVGKRNDSTATGSVQIMKGHFAKVSTLTGTYSTAFSSSQSDTAVNWRVSGTMSASGNNIHINVNADANAALWTAIARVSYLA